MDFRIGSNLEYENLDWIRLDRIQTLIGLDSD